MKWSESFIPTLREDPQEAEIASHRLMLRAGLIRRLSGGLYTFLPVGLKALQNVERIIREEMNAAGAQEILMPALQPREIWDRSERYESMADVMFRAADHQQREFVLGPTHEEVVTSLMAGELRSYRQMPVNLYQIQTKFRDEIRPRFGLMRAKEFIMKDAYSFDSSSEGADESYRKMYEAYRRIFERCGLRTKVVEAETGAMGGKSSHEFMVLAESGEDGLVECTACSYAANLERAERAQSHSAPDNQDSPEKPESVDTPGARTVEEVAQFLKRPQDQLVKTLIYIADGKPVAILAAGDREVNENKVMRHLGVDSVELADDATIEKVTKAPVGFAGPSGLEIAVYADFDLEGRSNVITGGNKQDTHMTGINIARDVNVTSYHDFCVPAEGDPCPRCREPMAERRGIEIGHVFKLGTKYSKTLGARFLDESGTEQPAIMGCYGIGVTRTLQAVIEQCHDEKGIIWPVPVAPYNVAVLLLDPAHDEAARITSELTEKLESENLSVIVDERDERPGVKFNDSELLGFPIQAVIGKRSLAKQSIEISYRQSGKKELVPVEEAAERIAEYCKTPC